jgi:oxygen-independent coproporphyrinogen III oxidase
MARYPWLVNLASTAQDFEEFVLHPASPDLAMLARYDRAGPRYTSYPTAPHFSSDFGPADFETFASRSDSQGAQKPLALYVHIPFCSSPCFYCGCNRVITRSPARGDQYVSRLRREMDRVSPLFAHKQVHQVHFGGGTPNFLRPEQLEELVTALRERFNVRGSADTELSIELDPRFLQIGDIARLAAAGFNRVSLGVQDFDTEVQAAVNRFQTVQQSMAAIQSCRDVGIDSINVDLMYGLPRQRLDGFRRTLEQIVAARPSRLATYGYAHMPASFKAQRQIRAEDLPDPQTRVALLGAAFESLTGAGYRYIGMDHFALPVDELVAAQDSGTLQRNFMGYTTHGGSDLLGLGVSAISHLGHSFSQNPRDLAAWEAQVDAGRLPVWRGRALDEDDRLRSAVIERLMCEADVDVAAIERTYQIDFWSYFAAAREKLRPLEHDRLVWVCSSHITASPQGRYFLRAIATCFDRYLQQSPSPDSTTRFSNLI